MSKRAFLILLSLCLPLGLAGLHPAAKAAGTPINPTAAAGWRGIPDLDAASGRFLTVTGLKNSALPGGAGEDPGQLVATMIFTLDPTDPTDLAKVAVFDGDTDGLWDQRDDLPPVSSAVGVQKPFNTRYRIYPDPTGGVARAIARGDRSTAEDVAPVDANGNPEKDSTGNVLPAVSPVVNLTAKDEPFVGSNAEWMQILQTAGSNDALYRTLSNGQKVFVYSIRVTLEGLQNYPLNEWEMNGFKLAFTGQPRLPRGTLVGFVGGAVDFRWNNHVGNTEDPLPGQTIPIPGPDEETHTNGYDGQFDFTFEPGQVCQDLTLFEADADWNQPINPEDPYGDPNPTGMPPDDAGRAQYVESDGLKHVYDNTSFKVALPAADENAGRTGLLWEIIDPTDTVRLASYTNSPFHPSINATDQLAQDGTVFQQATLSKAVLNSQQGTWSWRWRGVDARNSIWIKADGGLGPDLEGPEATITVFCDANSNGQYDAGEELAGAAVTVQAVTAGLPSAGPFTTDAKGQIQTRALQAGDWQITGITPAADPCTSFSATLPVSFTVDMCDGATVDVPGTCSPCNGNLSGHVYREVRTCDGAFQPAQGETGINGVTVQLFDATVTPNTLVATTTTDSNGAYAFQNVSAGTYNVVVDTTQSAVLGLKAFSPTTGILANVTVTAGQDSTNNDFFFCPAEITVRVFKKAQGQACMNTVTQGDTPIPGVQVFLKGPLPAQTLSGPATTDSNGEATFTDLLGGSYQVIVNSSGQAPLSGLVAATGADLIDVSLPDGTLKVVDSVWCESPGLISGHVYREVRTCDGVFEPQNGELGISGVSVQLYDVSTTPATLVDSTTTDATGSYEFNPVQPGMYRIVVDETQPAVQYLSASSPSPAVISPVVIDAGGKSENNDFFFCPAEILVRVFKRAHGQACDNTITVGDTPLAGVTVSLDGTNPVRPPQVGVTDGNGEVKFSNLLGGEWRVEVSGQSLSGLDPAVDPPIFTVQLPAGDARVVDSVWCEHPCAITGRVIRDDNCDAWGNDQGVAIPGVQVDLFKAADYPNGAVTASMTTNAMGAFSFQDLLAGSYIVRIPDGQNVVADMSSTTGTVITIPSCPADVVFKYGTAKLTVQTVLDVKADGTEGPLSGVSLTLTKLDAPGANRTWPGTSDANGQFVFPVPLLPGLYQVKADYVGNVLLASPNPQTVLLTICQPQTLKFRWVGVGSLVGYVIKETVDCNGVREAGEPGVAGVQVVLVPTNPIGPARVATTDANGYYQFLNLPRGQYAVQVPGGQAQLLNLDPTSPNPPVASVTIVPPDQAEQDFFYCPPARLHGIVFREPAGNCDGKYDPPTDVGIGGVRVDLLEDVGGGQTVSFFTYTLPDGTFRFDDLEAGDYELSVDGSQPQLVHLSASTSETRTFSLAPEEDREEDFGYCSQIIRGTVFREPAGDCDGVYNPPKDVGIAGVQVVVRSTDAGTNLVEYTRTDANGDYAFTDLPPGNYEIQVDGQDPVNVALLAGLSPSSATLLTPLLPHGEIVEHQDFGYCPPETGDICGTVYKEPYGNCNGVLDQGDTRLAGIEVLLLRGTDPNTAVEVDSRVTDVDGGYCFLGLDAGNYVVAIRQADNPALVNLDPSTPVRVPVTLVPLDKEQVDFGWCPPCEKTPCCEGELHEVVVETKFWLDNLTDFDLHVLFQSCCADESGDIDLADISWTGAFPGPVTGYNGVITIDSVRIEQGWVVVRIRLTARGCAFPRGLFGPLCRCLTVTLNGQKNFGKSVYRCQYLRPGTFFTFSEACGIPDCDPNNPPNHVWNIVTDQPNGGCDARFLVVDTFGWDNWLACHKPPPCKEQSVSCSCGFNRVDLDLEYQTASASQHAFKLLLKKYGVVTLDSLNVSFTGNEWHGQKRGLGGYVTVTDIVRVQSGPSSDLWRAHVRVQRCDRKDLNPSTLPALVGVVSRFDGIDANASLDLSWWNQTCLATGAVLDASGAPTGATVTNWVSVKDAAWCPPVICGGECDCGCEPPKGNICGTVYRQPPENCNQIFDDGDVGIAGVTVELYRLAAAGGSTLVAQMTTDADGHYCFLDLDAGQYEVVIPGPTTGQPTQTALVDLKADTPEQVVVAIQTGSRTVDFGYCPELEGSICGTVYKQPVGNCNGKLDNGDTGIAGVQVVLYSLTPANGRQQVGQALTDANGGYCFKKLTFGVYEVDVPDSGSQAPLTGLTADTPEQVVVTLPAGGNETVDFGYCPPELGRICGTVYRQPVGNCNGILDNGDTGIPGVQVSLYKIAPEGETLVATVTTGADGGYCFNDLAIGFYRVTVPDSNTQAPLVGLTADSPESVLVPILAGSHATVDFGYCPEQGSICGTVYRQPKNNCNGMLDPGDTGIAGVVVHLEKVAVPSPIVIATQLTNAAGKYCFGKLDAGDYQVVIPGARSQPPLLGLTPDTPELVAVSLPIGGNETVDFGYCPELGSICGTVYRQPKENCNGKLDDGDTGIAGVAVSLDLVQAGGQHVHVADTTTDADGHYCFLDLDLGMYEVSVPNSAQQIPLADLKPDSPEQVLVALQIAEQKTVDFGYCPELGSICGTVYRQPVNNCNGVFDSGDTGIAGAVVDLYRRDASGNATKIDSATTDADGKYCFLNLEFGFYEVRIDATQGVLVGLKPDSPTQVVVPLDAGAHVTVDFGFCPPPCGTCSGKVTLLSLRYDGSSSAQVRVDTKSGTVYNQAVASGQVFTFHGNDKDGTLGTSIDVFVNGTEDTPIHTSCSQPIGPGLVKGSFTIVYGESLKGGPLCPLTETCGKCDGGVSKLSLRYDGASTAQIRVSTSKGDVFNGTVASSEVFSFSGLDKDGKLGTSIDVIANGQTTSIHTSCSQPIGIGSVFGPYTVMDGASVKGGKFCENVPSSGGCSHGIVGFLVKYTGPNIPGPATMTFSASNVTVTYDFPNGLDTGEILAANSESSGGRMFTINAAAHGGSKLGTQTTITLNGQVFEVFHTSCSCPSFNFVIGEPACLDASSPDNSTGKKGAPSPAFTVVDFQ